MVPASFAQFYFKEFVATRAPRGVSKLARLVRRRQSSEPALVVVEQIAALVPFGLVAVCLIHLASGRHGPALSDLENIGMTPSGSAYENGVDALALLACVSKGVEECPGLSGALMKLHHAGHQFERLIGTALALAASRTERPTTSANGFFHGRAFPVAFAKASDRPR
jgi:hypothetical protein